MSAAAEVLPAAPVGCYRPAGLHVVADLYGIQPDLLQDARFLEEMSRQAALAAGAQVLQVSSHAFGPGQGVAGVVLLAESHLTFHTWPEDGVALFDAFMCGNCDPHLAIDYVRARLGPGRAVVKAIDRGVT